MQHVGGIARRRRQTRGKIPEYQMFSRAFIPNPYYTSAMEDFDLMGYSVTSGRFRSKDELLYVGGAPRGAGSHGKVSSRDVLVCLFFCSGESSFVC